MRANMGTRERQELVKLAQTMGELDFRSRHVAEEICAHAQRQGLQAEVRSQRGGLFAVEVHRA